MFKKTSLSAAAQVITDIPFFFPKLSYQFQIQWAILRVLGITVLKRAR